MTMLGKKHKEKTKEKIGEAIKKKWNNPEFREKTSKALRGKRNPFYGRKHSEETKQKISNANRGRRLSDETKQKFKEIHSMPSEETRKKISEATRKALAEMSFETKFHWHSKINKNRWAKLSHEERIQHTRAMRLAAQKANPSSLELPIAQILDALEISYKSQKSIGPYIVDFYLPGHNLIIECDGDYWHSLPGRKEKDQKRDRWLRGHGYEVLRLNEDAIRNDPHLAIVEGLKLKEGNQNDYD